MPTVAASQCQVTPRGVFVRCVRGLPLDAVGEYEPGPGMGPGHKEGPGRVRFDRYANRSLA